MCVGPRGLQSTTVLW